MFNIRIEEVDGFNEGYWLQSYPPHLDALVEHCLAGKNWRSDDEFVCSFIVIWEAHGWTVQMPLSLKQKYKKFKESRV